MHLVLEFSYDKHYIKYKRRFLTDYLKATYSRHKVFSRRTVYKLPYDVYSRTEIPPKILDLLDIPKKLIPDVLYYRGSITMNNIFLAAHGLYKKS